jgi:hypothetical protein
MAAGDMAAASEVTRTAAAVDFAAPRAEVSTVGADSTVAVAADSTVAVAAADSTVVVAATAAVVAADTGNRH